ncbi:hypothetical protein BDB01DRAFT_776569 [Pilobolus umbonatus]|nr:hypothetical protein BDB01DRAFT_776569 [Pilobolus umbonatus]
MEVISSPVSSKLMPLAASSKATSQPNKQKNNRSSNARNFQKKKNCKAQNKVYSTQYNCGHDHDSIKKRAPSPAPENEEHDIMEIVYSAPTEMLTPPPSPKASSQQRPASDTFKANERILAAKRNGNMKCLLSEYTTLKKEGCLFTDHTYNVLFECYSSLRREGTPLTPLLKMYEDMRKAKIQPSSSTYSNLIRILCKRDVEVQKVIAMLKRQSARSTNKSGNNMMDLESEENLKKALSIFNAAVSENVIQFFEIDIYNQILRVLSHYGNTKDSLLIYEQLERHSIPTSATFAALINLFGRVGDLDSAIVNYNKYKNLADTAGPHDSSYVYNALVDAHLKCNNLEGAIKVINEDMVSNNVSISTIPYNSVIRYYCMNEMMDEVEEFILCMKQSAPQPDASSYGPILSAYCHLNKFKEATRTYESLITTDISKSYGNLANYALLCLKNNEYARKAIDVVSDMKSANLEPDSSLAEVIISHFGKIGDIPVAINAIKTILNTVKPRSLHKSISQIKSAASKVAQASGGSFSQTMEIAHLISSHCNQGLSSPLARILIENYEFEPDHRNLQESDYSILLGAAVTISNDTSSTRRKDSSLPTFGSLVNTIHTEMSSKDIKLSHATRSIIVAEFQRLGDKKSSEKWAFSKDATVCKFTAVNVGETEEASVAVMKAAVQGRLAESIEILRNRIFNPRLLPIAEPLRDAIAFVGKQGHLQTALEMYHLATKSFQNCSASMEPQHLEKAIYMMTNSILIAYAQQGDMVNAKKYYEHIKSMGRYPDGNGYASLLLGSAKCATDEATDALIIYDEAKRHDVKPTTFFYNVVISKLAKARKLESAMRLFDEMQSFKIMPNSITYGAVISASVRAGSEVSACRLFDEMLSSPSFQPRVAPFNNMIQFYVRQQPDRTRALEYFAELRRRHIKPSAHTYKLLMEAYCFIAPYDMTTAHCMLEEMKLYDDIPPQATHYATLIHSYGILQHDIVNATHLFEQMEKNKIVKDEVVYQAMLDNLISNNQLTKAEKLYSEMQSTIDKSNSPYIENIFIRGYGEKGLLNKARTVFDAMTDDKITSNGASMVIREPSTYETMIRAYIDNNQMSEAKEIFQLMVQREFPEKVTASVRQLIMVESSESI